MAKLLHQTTQHILSFNANPKVHQGTLKNNSQLQDQPLTPVDNPLLPFSKFITSLIFQILHGSALPTDLRPTYHYQLEYIHGVLSASPTQPQPLILALIYIARTRSNTSKRLSKGGEGHLFAVALMLASKFCEDENANLKSWSALTGIATNVLARMEWELLECLQVTSQFPFYF